MRRWRRFSVRSLLITLTLICLYLGRVAERAHRQQEIAVHFERLGAQVYFCREYQRDVFGAPYVIRQSNGALVTRDDAPKLSPSTTLSSNQWPWWRRWLGEPFFRDVDCVDCQGIQLTERDLDYLEELPAIQDIELSEKYFDDDLLARLRRMREVRVVWMDVDYDFDSAQSWESKANKSLERFRRTLPNTSFGAKGVWVDERPQFGWYSR
ncbi:MAG: hypothetical protein SGJ19_13820 [Planctomycetia bacterium]|nr:hypothetical protein [Planctomycetia bacterium]